MRFAERNLIRIPVAGLVCVCAWQVAILPSRIADGLRPKLTELGAAVGDIHNAAYNLAVASGDIKDVTAKLADPRDGVARTLRNVNTLTVQGARAATVARLASSEQRKYLAETSAEVVGAARAAKVAVERLDKNLNDRALVALTSDLAKLGTSISTLDAAVESLERDGHVMMAETTATIVAAREPLESAGRLLADPSVPSATKALASAAQHVDTSMGYIESGLRPPPKLGLLRSIGVSLIPAVFRSAVEILLNRKFPERTVVVAK